MTQRKLFNKRDFWLLAGLILLALLAYFWRGVSGSGGERIAQVSVGGQVVWTMPLAYGDNATFVPDGSNVLLALSNGAAAFVSSDCPDQICVRSGALSLPGQIAVCLPNRTALLIVGEPQPANGDADTFAY